MLQTFLDRLVTCPWCTLEFFLRDHEVVNGAARCPDCNRIIKFDPLK